MSLPALLVTGGSGQVGSGIIAANRGRFILITPSRNALDLTDRLAIEAMVKSREWAAMINCGAYTEVDKAESDKGSANAINAVAPGLLAQAAAARDIPLLHVSTDYVFDGAKSTAYDESDPVAPLGVYGASKEAGERAVRAAKGRHIILRTAWVISPWGQNFVKTMLRLASEREKLGVVSDQLGCPTSATDIAETLLALTERLLADPGSPTGTYHFVNQGSASWHDLAATVFRYAQARGQAVPRLDAITTSDYPTPARRPANSRLSTTKLQRDFGIVPRPWQEALDDILAVLIDGKKGERR